MINVFLIDDNEAFRESTSWLLESFDFKVRDYASAKSFLDDLPTVINFASSCIVSDIRMPNLTGIQLLEKLNDKQVNTPVICITGHGDIPLAVEAMRLGAVDFIEKPFAPATLTSSIERAVAFAEQGSNVLHNDQLQELTHRQREVLGLIVESKPNKVIAYELGISVKTVEMHRARLMERLHAHSLQDLMRIVLAPEKTASH